MLPRVRNLNLIFIGSSVLGLIAYFFDYLKPSYHPNFLFPDSIAFWNHFLSILLLGTGNRNMELRPLSVIILGLNIYLALKLFKNWKKASAKDRFLLFVSITLLGVLASISISRAGLGADQAFSSRYYEFSVFYLIYVVAMFANEFPNIKNRYVVFLFLIFLSQSIKTYDFNQYYGGMTEQRRRGLLCLQQSVQTKIDKICSDLYPLQPLAPIIRDLKQSHPNLSFLKNFD